MHPLIAALAVSLLAVLVGMPTARADIRLDYVAHVGDTPVDTLWLSGSLLRADGNNQSAIIDSSANRVTLVDHGSRSYVHLDESQMEALADIADMAAQGARSVMDWLPEEAREAIAGLGLDEQPQAATSLRLLPTGQTQRVAGFDCQMHRLDAATRELQLCLADSAALGLAAAERQTVARALRLMHRLAGRLARWDISGLPLAQMDGTRLPLRILEADGQAVIVDTQLSRVSGEVLAASLFAVPQGYSQQRDAGAWMPSQ